MSVSPLPHEVKQLCGLHKAVPCLGVGGALGFARHITLLCKLLSLSPHCSWSSEEKQQLHVPYWLPRQGRGAVCTARQGAMQSVLPRPPLGTLLVPGAVLHASITSFHYLRISSVKIFKVLTWFCCTCGIQIRDMVGQAQCDTSNKLTSDERA